MCVLMYHVTWGLTIAWLHTYLKVSSETLTSGKGRGDVYWIDPCTPSLSKFIPHPEMRASLHMIPHAVNNPFKDSNGY